MIRKSSTINFCFVKNSNHIYIYMYTYIYNTFPVLLPFLLASGFAVVLWSFLFLVATLQQQERCVRCQRRWYKKLNNLSIGQSHTWQGALEFHAREFHRRSFTGQTFCQVKQHVEREIPVPKPYLQTLEVVQQVGGVSHWQFSTFMLSVAHESLPCVVKPILSQTL